MNRHKWRVLKIATAADYGNNPQRFNDQRRMVSGHDHWPARHAIAAQVQQKQDDLRRYFPADGVRLKIINGVLTSLKMITSHEQGRTAFEIGGLGNISQR